MMRSALLPALLVISTIEHSVPSILVSGTALTIVGFLLGNISTHGLLAQLGIFIGRGAICSMVKVAFVLPSLLSIFDRFFIGEKLKIRKDKT